MVQDRVKLLQGWGVATYRGRSIVKTRMHYTAALPPVDRMQNGVGETTMT
jgi:hypothetical protein